LSYDVAERSYEFGKITHSLDSEIMQGPGHDLQSSWRPVSDGANNFFHAVHNSKYSSPRKLL